MLEHKTLMMPLQRMTEKKGLREESKIKDMSAEERKKRISWKTFISATIHRNNVSSEHARGLN